MKTVLVTGAYGFVGRHVARAAAHAGWHVLGIGHGSWGRDEWRQWGLQDWHADDISIEALITYGGKPDLIVHCAGGGSVGFSMGHPQQDFNRTVVGTLSVLEFIRSYAPEAALVLPSSAAVYGNCGDLPIRIDSTKNPTSPYGLHKKMAEELCQSYARHFHLKVAMVRLFSVFGQGLRKQLLWDACGKIAQGRAVFSGTGHETRDWIHVEDAARLLLAAADRADVTCPVANGGTGRQHSIEDIVSRLCDAFATGVVPAFDGIQRAGDPLHYQANIDEALAWGWTPQEDLTSQLAAYVAWYKDEQS